MIAAQRDYASALLVYLILVARSRFRRVESMKEPFMLSGRQSFAKMTTDEAHGILKDMTELEFPRFMGFSIIFALFKTYGIPSVSSLLVATGELATQETTSKRVADTGVLILEFALNAPSSQRTIAAIARMNYLHGRYRKSGKIRGSDMLYTLSVFALEPRRWINKYEWRSMSEVEVCACGTYWKAMGDAMEISYEALPSSQEGWLDGLHWLKELEEWSLAYEEAQMVPAESNHRLAEAHLNLLFVGLPPQLLQIGKNVVSFVLEPRLRTALKYPKAPATYHLLISTALYIRRVVLRHFALPRPEFARKKFIPSRHNPVTGRYNSLEYLSFPWYVEPTLMRRWGPRALMGWILRRKLPGDDGNKYAPEGYAFSEIGPLSMRGKGSTEMEKTEARLRTARRGGCPFA